MMEPAIYLRKTFQIKSGLKKATISQTAHGLYEFWINGTLGTEDKFKPGFTSYHMRLQTGSHKARMFGQSSLQMDGGGE